MDNEAQHNTNDRVSIEGEEEGVVQWCRVSGGSQAANALLQMHCLLIFNVEADRSLPRLIIRFRIYNAFSL
jgi:hypothetical protein